MWDILFDKLYTEEDQVLGCNCEPFEEDTRPRELSRDVDVNNSCLVSSCMDIQAVIGTVKITKA